MSTTSIKLKKSSVSGKVPLEGDIDYGELALNYTDGKLFYKHSDNSIRSFLDSNQIYYLIDSDYLKSIINQEYLEVTRPIFVVEDATPALGGNLSLNGHNITDSGTSGSITMSGNITGGTITATADFRSTAAWDATAGGGQLYLNGATGNRIDFNTNGVAGPSYTTRSAGTKLLLYPALSGVQVDYAMGISPATMWSTVPANDSAFSFKWYGGDIEVASLTGNGKFSAGTITSTGDIIGTNLISTMSSGDEGGEIKLAKPVTNTSLAGSGVIIDVYQNRLRFFEQGSPNRGAYIDLTTADSNLGTNLLGAAAPGDGTLTLAVSGTGLSGSASFTANQYTGSTFTVTSNATSANTAGAIVARDSSGNFTAGVIIGDQVISTNNGAGTNFKVGDDAWIGDINLANTIRITGQQDATQGYLVFGNSSGTALGRSGTGRLTYGGNSVILAGDSGTVTSSMIANTGVAAGTYGSASLVPVLTVNAQGQVDSIGTVSVAGVSSTDWDSATGNFIISTADGGSYYTKITLDPYTTTNLGEGTNKYYTKLRADSDARNALTGSTGITYTRSTGAITTNDAQIVHDNLSGFVANEHIDHSAVTLTAGVGLNGGGTIAASRTFNIDSAELYANFSHDAFKDFVSNEHIDHSSVSIIAGNGLTGGGTIAASRTLSIDSSQIKGLFSAGTGVTYNSGTGSISIGQAIGTGNTPTFTGLSAGSSRITSVATPSASTDAANKGYVDEVAQGLKAAPAVEVATTANLSATYNNGTLGVGATLTSTTNGAFPTIDGVTVATTTPGNNGVLVKNQSSSLQNGRYNLTQVGDASNPWILTRCGVCDQSSEIPGSYVFVTGGDNQANTGWTAYVTDTTTFTVGTDNITYFQFSGAGTYTAGSGLKLTGSVFSIDSATPAPLATKLANARTIAISGDITGTATSFDGSASITITSAITSGSIVNADINASAAIADTKLATISTAGKVSNSATTATNANTASAIVARDASGNFLAGTITAALSGNATTATTLQTARNIGGVSFNGSANIDLPGVNTAGNQNTSGTAAGITGYSGTYWTSNNDGASSGLDADLLDGQHGSYYRINVYNSSGTLLN